MCPNRNHSLSASHTFSKPGNRFTKNETGNFFPATSTTEYVGESTIYVNAILHVHTNIKEPAGIILTISIRNFVAATFPWEVTNSFKVNINVTRLVVRNSSLNLEYSVTASAWWKVTVALFNEIFAASVILSRIDSHPGHESKTSKFTSVSLSQSEEHVLELM